MCTYLMAGEMLQQLLLLAVLHLQEQLQPTLVLQPDLLQKPQLMLPSQPAARCQPRRPMLEPLSLLKSKTNIALYSEAVEALCEVCAILAINIQTCTILTEGTKNGVVCVELL